MCFHLRSDITVGDEKQVIIVKYGTSAGEFTIYKEKLEQFIANDIAEEKKVPVLITTLDSAVYMILRDLCHLEIPHTSTCVQF